MKQDLRRTDTEKSQSFIIIHWLLKELAREDFIFRKFTRPAQL